MNVIHSALTVYLLEITFVLLCLLNSILGRRSWALDDAVISKPVNYGQHSQVQLSQFPDSEVYGRGYDRDEQETRVKTALARLDHAPQWDPNWPDPAVRIGQVSGVAMTMSGHILVFHRGPNVWDGTTFNMHNVYQNIGEPAIAEPTIFVFNQNGTLVDKWGENLFYMPHGITSDAAGNVWVTDVALHQVFKFTPHQRTRPQMVLGEKFVPRDDDAHFCKPSAVAVTSNGDFFVADGYCNTRIIKYAPDGTKILQWGRRSGDSPFVFEIPHALTLAEERGQVCVADRERGRVGCFMTTNGTYVNSYRNWLIGQRLFSVAYASVAGGRLYVVNGPPFSGDVPVRGYVIDFDSGRLIQTFAPGDEFSNPHDIVTTPDGSEIYVAELRPFKVYKFVDEELKTASGAASANNASVPVKPTATVAEMQAPSSITGDAGGGGISQWGAGAAGGVAGAVGGGMLLLGAALLVRARNKGCKGAPRRRWEYGSSEFKLRRLLARRRFTRVRSDDSDEEPSPMLPAPEA